MGVAKLSKKGLKVILDLDGGKEHFTTNDSYPENFDNVFSQFSAYYLVIPHLPKVIESDFPIHKSIVDIINKTYALKNKPAPTIVAEISKDSLVDCLTKNEHRTVVSYSGGKDSMWNLWWAQEKYGKDNVLAVHIDGLNKATSSSEKEYSIMQSKKLGFPLEIMKLVYGSKVNGYMARTFGGIFELRRIFNIGILLPYAIGFNASSIIVEGFGSKNDKMGEKLLNYFNKKMTSMNLPLAEWRNTPRMDSVKDLYEHRPDWLAEVCNCFTNKCYWPGIRRSWIGGEDRKGNVIVGRAPSFKLYDSQCGSCVKCRITNIGRILYDKNLTATEEDIKFYIKSTEDWYKMKVVTHSDMITGSFLRDFRKAAKMYDIKLTKI